MRDALDEHVLAAVRLDEVRPEVVPVAEHALGDRHALRRDLDQPRASRRLRVRRDSLAPPFHGHQCVGVRLAVERAAAR